ncbi:GntR family transcriptional regulator [Bacillaceae bacterium Marseille-Q3522]|nr:GntR family transcriptional regulator [Bacillaceae bacterium Marseille-Q3522]
MEQADTQAYLEIAEFIIQGIKDGRFAENEKIPSESEFCRLFAAKRSIVRQAIARVTHLGWITPVQGKGSYVNRVPKTIPYVLSSKTRFSEIMEAYGLNYTGKLLNWEKTLPDAEEKKSLGLQKIEAVYRLEIIRYVDESPLSLTTSVLPEAFVPNLEQYLEDFQSLYEILMKNYHFRPIRAKSVFEAIQPKLTDAASLDLPENIPIVQMESLMHHPSGEPVEYCISRIRGDRYKYVIEF